MNKHMEVKPRLSLENIEEASRIIDPVFTGSPQFTDPGLNEELGFELACKVETLNPIKSFKGRGADYLVKKLPRDVDRLVCASAGNFGQGMAYAAGGRGMRLTVFAAENANPVKLERMLKLGAEVITGGRDFDEAKAAAKEYAERKGVYFVEDGREPATAEGAGTIGLELARWPLPPKQFDAILVPLGNGALLAGVGLWFKAISPQTQVIGVCAEGAPAMERSWSSGHSVSTEKAETIADGIAVRVPVSEALDDLRFVVDDVLLVDDRIILGAMKLLFRCLGAVIEPAGAAGAAAAVKYRERFAGQTVATVLCGGNLTEMQKRNWLFP
jgi:threonine dehydratase